MCGWCEEVQIRVAFFVYGVSDFRTLYKRFLMDD